MLAGQISKEQIRKGLDSIYLVAFALFLALAFMYTTTFEIEWPEFLYYDIRLFLFAIVFARIILSDAYTLRESILAVLIFVVFFAAWRRNSEDIMLNTLLLVLGSKGISFRKMMKVYFGVTCGLLLITMYAALSGKIENLVYFQNGRRMRVAFGICYPTDFSAHVFYMILAYGYIRRERIKYFEIAIIAALGAGVYYFCDARVNTVCILVTAGILFYNKFRIEQAVKRRKNYEMNPIWSALLALSTTLCATFMIVMTLLYTSENKLTVLIDRIINNRLRLGKKGIELFGFSLFGKWIPMQGSGGSTKELVRYFFLDSSYINIALQYGVLILGIVLIICCCIGFRAREEKNWIFLWIMSIVAVQCMIEHHMLDISYNPFLWALFANTVSEPIRELKQVRKEKL